MSLARALATRLPSAALGALAVCLALALERSTLGAAPPPRVFSDSAVFETGASASWASAELWAGPRGATPLLLFKLAGGDRARLIRIQRAVSLAGWSALALACAGMFRGRVLPWAVGGSVLGFAFTWPVKAWDAALLSESVTFSCAALLTASAIWLARARARPLRRPLVLIGFAASALLFAGCRDTALYSLASLWLGVSLLAGWLAFRAAADGPGRNPRGGDLALAAAAAGALLAILVLGQWSAERSGRWRTPVLNVLLQRVLPDAPRRAHWHARYQLPRNALLLSWSGRFAWDPGPSGRAPRERLFRPLPQEDEGLAAVREWFASRALPSLRSDLLAHPLRSLVEAGRAFPDLQADRAERYLAHVPRAGWVDAWSEWLFPPIPPGGVAWLLAVQALGLAAVSRGAPGCRGPALLSAALTANALIQFGVAYHGDTAELARHAFLHAIWLRLSLLISAWIAVDRLRAALARRLPRATPSAVAPVG